MKQVLAGRLLKAKWLGEPCDGFEDDHLPVPFGSCNKSNASGHARSVTKILMPSGRIPYAQQAIPAACAYPFTGSIYCITNAIFLSKKFIINAIYNPKLS